MSESIDYVIVQAGGKGTRLEYLTSNKPKALVPYDNLPVLFGIFKSFPGANFIIIGDYKADVLKKYLQTFSRERYIFLNSIDSGNASGIKEALQYIPEGKRFLITWCDLLLPSEVSFPDSGECIVGTTDDFRCSWKFNGHSLVKESTNKNGVIGVFVFRDKKFLNGIESKGSFTSWLAQQENLEKIAFKVPQVIETGSLKIHQEMALKKKRCRPYNHLVFEEDKVTKKALTVDGEALLVHERYWFKKALEFGFCSIPKIHKYEPLIMERIQGDNIYRASLDENGKRNVLSQLVEKVKVLHACAQQPANNFDLHEEYFNKTLKRLKSIANAIPFSSENFININGVSCRNVLYEDDFLFALVKKISNCRFFTPIHGDCTLTNTLLSTEGSIFFIDARGYFGKTKFFGDPDYDWAKLYYSIVGNFDNFNEKKFQLKIKEKCVEFNVESNGWEFLESFFFETCEADPVRIKIIHAIIWLSLASHCWEDYDSMCLAYYNGLYLLNDLK